MFKLVSVAEETGLSFDLLETTKTGPYNIKLFLCSTQLTSKFILLINVKLPTIVGILTFISMINTTTERLNARNFFNCPYFNFYEQLILFDLILYVSHQQSFS